MKILFTESHEDFMISVFAWNQKYLLKFEQEDLEQTYKISELELSGEQDLRIILEDEDFLQKVAERFSQMRRDFQASIEF